MVKGRVVKSQYSQEFKNQVLEVLENTPKSMAQVARGFGIYYPRLNNWKCSKGNKDKSNLKQNTEEMKKLLREFELLKKENEVLKKVATFLCTVDVV